MKTLTKNGYELTYILVNVEDENEQNCIIASFKKKSSICQMYDEN